MYTLKVLCIQNKVVFLTDGSRTIKKAYVHLKLTQHCRSIIVHIK